MDLETSSATTFVERQDNVVCMPVAVLVMLLPVIPQWRRTRLQVQSQRNSRVGSSVELLAGIVLTNVVLLVIRHRCVPTTGAKSW